MFCVNCGSRLEENAQFCIFCGKPVSKNGSQEIAVQKSAGGQIAASQPEVLRKLSHRLIASMALWAVAVALWMIMMKGSFSSWNMIGKVSGIIELIILVGIVFTRLDESKNVYTNIIKIDEDYGEICSSTGFIIGVWTCMDLFATGVTFGYVHPMLLLLLILCGVDILLINIYVRIHGEEIQRLAQMEQKRLEEQKIESEEDGE